MGEGVGVWFFYLLLGLFYLLVGLAFLTLIWCFSLCLMYFVLLWFVVIFLESCCFLMSDRKGVNPDGKGGGEGLGRVERGENVSILYWMKKESMVYKSWDIHIRQNMHCSSFGSNVCFIFVYVFGHVYVGACKSYKRVSDTLELELQSCASSVIDAGNYIPFFCKRNKHSYPQSHLFSPRSAYFESSEVFRKGILSVRSMPLRAGLWELSPVLDSKLCTALLEGKSLHWELFFAWITSSLP